MARNQPEGDVDLPDEPNAPPEVRSAFWSLVVVFNAAILAVSVGAMLVGFQGRWATGGSLFLAGALAFAFGTYRLRTVRDRLGEPNDASSDTR